MATEKAKSARAGWAPLATFDPRKMNRGIHLDIAAVEGQGKSSLALTLARCGVVGYVDVDQSIDRARRPGTKKDKLNDRIRALPIRYSAGMNPDTVKDQCLPAWKTFKRGVAEALPWATGGIIYDTDTELWELIRLARFGTLTPRGRTDKMYGELNAEFRNLHRDVNRVAKRHLVTVHQLKDEYKDVVRDGKPESVKTGRLQRAGMREIGYLADIAVRMSRKGAEFQVEIEMCKFNPGLEGTVLEGDDIDFARIVALATDTEPEDWYR